MGKADGLIANIVTEWKAPEEIKGPDARILTMPNIPQPLHGCLEGCAEVLTPDGWQRIDTLSEGDTVMCWSNGSLFFDEVLATIETDVPYAYKIGFQKAKNFDMLYSPGHRIPMVEKIYSWGRKGRNKYETPKEVLRVKTAEEYIPNTARSFYTAGRGTGPVEHLSADERLLIAIQADGYLVRHNYKHNNLYKYRISISKVRKMSRLRELLEKTSFKWRELSGDDGYKKFNIWVPKESKTFSNVFQWNMPYAKAREFIQELWEWDGHVGASAFGTQRASYNSTRYDNIAFVQAIAAQAGYTTNTRADTRGSRNACWAVEFIDKGTRGCGNTKKEKVKYDDKMYCITVPSSFFLVKYHNIVMVTGNSGFQPRTIVGPSKWTIMRKKCYMRAGYECQACGKDVSEKGSAHAHELFSIDYATGTSTFERLVCLCEECVDADTEVLTSEGWKKIPTVTTNDKVACWDKDGSIKFDYPMKTIVSHKDKAIKITKGDATLYFSEGHRLPLKVASKQSSTSGEVRDILAGDYHASHYYNWMTGGNTIGEGRLTPDERVYIAIEADGCLTWDKENIGTRSSADGERQRERNSRYGSEDYRYTYRVSLSKTRKIERLKELLSNSTLKYEITKETSDSYCDFNIWTNVECKHFANCFSQEMSAEKALEFIEELAFWDGTFAKGETAWYTHKLEEAAFVQGVAAQCNIRTQVSIANRIGNLRKGQWKTPYERLTYTVYFKSIRNEICAREMKEEEVEWGKDMYCITTPTSYFIARRDNLVFVTGNCHVRFIHSGRMFSMLKKNSPLMTKQRVLEGIEHGFKIIKEYNDTHEKPIYPFAAFISGLEMDIISDEVAKLIEKYDMKFYGHINEKMGLARWQDWKMVYNGKEYRTTYADQNAWEAAMEEQHPEKIENPFSGGVFDEIDQILKEDK